MHNCEGPDFIQHIARLAACYPEEEGALGPPHAPPTFAWKRWRCERSDGFTILVSRVCPAVKELGNPRYCYLVLGDGSITAELTQSSYAGMVRVPPPAGCPCQRD